MSRVWMPIHVADYLTSTSHLSTAEHGAYLLLVMHYWKNSGLPVEDHRLALICRMSPAEWSDSRGTLAEFFDVVDGAWKPKVEWADIRKGSELRSQPAGWQATRLRIFARDAFRCTYCGSADDLHCDHVFPVAKGGSHDDSNLTTACRTCNTRKGAKTLEEWLS